MDLTTILDPVLAAKMLAVLGLLSAIKGLMGAFGNQDNKIIVWSSKIIDFFSANIRH